MVAHLARNAGHVMRSFGQVSISLRTLGLHVWTPTNSGLSLEHAEANRSTAALVRGWSYKEPLQAEKLGAVSVNVVYPWTYGETRLPVPACGKYLDNTPMADMLLVY